MAIEIRMPALSPTMEEGTLAKWLVKEGDKVASGDILAEIETDKATMEFEAVDEGVIAKIVVPEGTDEVKVGAVIAIMAEEGEDAASASAGAAAAAEPARVAAPAAPAQPARAPVEKPSDQKTEPAPESDTEQAPMETAARDLVAAVAHTVDEPEVPEGTELVRTTVREALRDAMAEEMRRDERVFVMGEEVAEYQGAYKVTQGLLDEFGAKRVIDTPITEYGFAGVGTGAAMGGLRPIVEFMTFNFAMQAIDHIINSAAKTNYMSGGQMRCPIVFRGPNGAAARVAAQHSQNFGPWYAAVPGLIVIAPYSAADAKGLLKAAIRSEDPVVFLENELLYGQSFDVPKLDDYVLPIGKARVVREGRDVTLVSYSIGVGVALDAAGQLAEQGIEAEVIDLRTLRPLDKATVLASLAKTNRMVCVEEGWPVCSISSEIMAVAMEEGFDDLDAPVLRVTNVDVPLPYAANLEKMALIKVADVVAAAKKVSYK
jgi:pyruvate dehydrogenase E1 component beta subunit